jgi:putative NIF3 family GTP cyclohydrolase 1 type 2
VCSSDLLKKIGVDKINIYKENNEFLAIGELDKELSIQDLSLLICEKLELPHVSYSQIKQDKLITRIGLIAGSGSGYGYLALKNNCQAYLTGEVRLHNRQYLSEMGVYMIELDHAVERIFISIISDLIKENFDLKITNIDDQKYPKIVLNPTNK